MTPLEKYLCKRIMELKSQNEILKNERRSLLEVNTALSQLSKDDAVAFSELEALLQAGQDLIMKETLAGAEEDSDGR